MIFKTGSFNNLFKVILSLSNKLIMLYLNYCVLTKGTYIKLF